MKLAKTIALSILSALSISAPAMAQTFFWVDVNDIPDNIRMSSHFYCQDKLNLTPSQVRYMMEYSEATPQVTIAWGRCMQDTYYKAGYIYNSAQRKYVRKPNMSYHPDGLPRIDSSTMMRDINYTRPNSLGYCGYRLCD